MSKTRQEEYKCKTCGESFATLEARDQHNKDAHKDMESTPIECEMCGANFTTQAELQNHARERHRESNGKTIESSGEAYDTREKTPTPDVKSGGVGIA